MSTSTPLRVDRVYIPSGAAIRYLREKAGLRVEGLAEMADLSASALYNIEAGRQSPSATTLAKLCAALTAALRKTDPTAEVTPNDLYLVHDRTVAGE